MTAVLVALLTFGSTVSGGVFAIRYRDHLHLILGFTAGVLIAVVAFDILPEIDRLARSSGGSFDGAMVALVAGFLTFHIIEKWAVIHSAHEHEYAAEHQHPVVGVLSAMALAAHSFFDGVAIGLAFQVSTSVGAAIALAVIAHDFADGLNTVALMLVNGNTSRRAVAFLVLDATTPTVGAASTLLFHLSDSTLLLYLGFFAGFLLYIGASDILPEAHANHPSRATLGLTVAGAALIYLVTRASF